MISRMPTPEADLTAPTHHDAHDHTHHHGRDDHANHADQGLLGRLGHLLGDVFGAHGHDSADQVDDVLEATAEGRRALRLSLLILLVTAVLQGVVVALSGSVALLGDTMHNVADALTAVPLLIAFRLGLRAADDRFTYGYGRAEDLAGIFVVTVIALSSAAAGFEAVRRLLHPQDVEHLWAVAAAAVVGFVGNEWVATYRIRVGRRIGSAALVADGLHARIDGITSLAVLLGVAGSAIGWRLADPIVGLVITVAILGILRGAVRQVGGRLMDAVDPGTVVTAREAVLSVPDVREVGELRIRWIGHALRAEVEVSTEPSTTVARADELADAVGTSLKQRLPRLASSAVRVRGAVRRP
ncbi:MAG: cation diffusion facilitator family transporter [Marmoricola sp.]|nr:cation diffusion facilitator family transporter [Marmoricola sp.]